MAAVATTVFGVALAVPACVGDTPVNPTDSGSDTTSPNDASNDTSSPDGSADAGDGGASEAGPPDASGTLLWVKSWATSDDFGVATDAQGNTFVGAMFTGSNVDFDGQKLSAVGSYDLAIVKLDSTGKVLWAKSFGGSGVTAAGRALTVDPNGDVYVTGDIDSSVGTITFGSSNVTSSSSTIAVAFLAKISGSTGAGLWAGQFTSGNSGANMWCYGVAASSTAAVASCQFNAKKVTYPGGTISNIEQPDAGSVHYDSALIALDPTNGTGKWANSFGAKFGGIPLPTDELFYQVTADPSGNFVVAGGACRGSSNALLLDTLGSVSASRVGADTQSTAFVGNFSASDGKANWVKLYGDPANAGGGYGTTAVVDPTKSKVFFGGQAVQTVDLGLGGVTAAGGFDGFALALDLSTKATSWVRSAGGPGTAAYGYGEEAVAVTSDAWSESIFVGESGGNTTVDGKPITSPAASSAAGTFVAKFGPTGSLLWANGYASSSTYNYVIPRGAAVTPSGEIRVAGFWQGTVSFDGNNPLTSLANGQGYLLGIAP